MAEINFPDNPTDGLIFSTDSKSWRWSQSGSAWVSIGADATGISGDVGNSMELVNGAIALDDDISINRIQIRDWSYLNLPLNIKLGSINYNFPTSNGLANQVLVSDGNENLTWQNNTVISNLAGTYSTSEAAEAAMPDEGFYTWTSSDGDNYKALAFKDSNKVWHLREYINNDRTFIVGDQPGDDFATPYDANRYLAHCDLGNDGIGVYVNIRPGVYQIPFPLVGHPQGHRIFYRPIDGSEPTYPVLEDFSTIASPSSASDLSMLRSKYPVQLEMSNDTNAIRSSTNSINFKNCLIIHTGTSTREAVKAQEAGHANVEGCAFFGWEDGVWSLASSDVRVTNCTSAWCSRNGFICQMSSSMKAGANNYIMAAHCQQALSVSEGSNAEIGDIQALAMQQRAVEVRHHSSLGENGNVTYTISGCNLANDIPGNDNTSGALHVRRNSYIKITSPTITGHKDKAIYCDGQSYIYLVGEMDIHDPAQGNTKPDIVIKSKSHIDAAVPVVSAFVNDHTIAFQHDSNIKVPFSTGFGDNQKADEGIYGSILIV